MNPEALRPKKLGTSFACPYCNNRYHFDSYRPVDIKPSILAVARLPYPKSRQLAFAVIAFFHQMSLDQLAATPSGFWIDHGMSAGHAFELCDIVDRKKRIQDGNPTLLDLLLG